jgi:hypothetical protein
VPWSRRRTAPDRGLRSWCVSLRCTHPIAGRPAPSRSVKSRDLCDVRSAGGAASYSKPGIARCRRALCGPTGRSRRQRSGIDVGSRNPCTLQPDFNQSRIQFRRYRHQNQGTESSRLPVKSAFAYFSGDCEKGCAPSRWRRRSECACGGSARREPQRMASPMQGEQRRNRVAGALPEDEPERIHPRRSGACQGLALACAPGLAPEHAPTR